MNQEVKRSTNGLEVTLGDGTGVNLCLPGLSDFVSPDQSDEAILARLCTQWGDKPGVTRSQLLSDGFIRSNDLLFLKQIKAKVYSSSNPRIENDTFSYSNLCGEEVEFGVEVSNEVIGLTLPSGIAVRLKWATGKHIGIYNDLLDKVRSDLTMEPTEVIRQTQIAMLRIAADVCVSWGSDGKTITYDQLVAPKGCDLPSAYLLSDVCSEYFFRVEPVEF